MNKKQIATMKVKHDMGLTANKIGKDMKVDPRTVRTWLRADVYKDPEIKNLMEVIKENEITDLALLGTKARYRLHEKLDAGEMKPIELIACQDRSFQQRRLLEGEPTANINIMKDVADKLKAIDVEASEWGAE